MPGITQDKVRTVILNKNTNEIKTTLTGVDIDVLFFVWDLSLLKVIAEGYDPSLISVETGGKIGKSNFKLSAPMSFWVLALKAAPLHRTVINQYFAKYGTDIFSDGKKVVIRAKIETSITEVSDGNK